MIYTKTKATSGPCHRCRIIRSFVMFTVMLVILAVVAGDKFQNFDFLTPGWFAAVIIVVGALVFFIKLISWKIFGKII